MSLLKKICLWSIYVGTAIILLTSLLVDNRFFFPFVTTKAFVFRLAVEAMFLAYLVLVVVDAEFRPRINWLFLSLTGFIAVAAISSWLGGNFSVSFWGDMERSEGLVLWLHLWAFLLVLTSVIRSEAAWKALLNISLGAGFLVALFGIGQYFQVGFLLNTSGSRVDATFGNAAFLGAYLLFQIALALYLLLKTSSLPLKVYYAALAVLSAWVIFLTQTRGAVLGLVAALFVTGIMVIFSYRRNRFMRTTVLAALAFLVLAGGFLFVSRDQSWIKDAPVLSRIASISSQDRTAQTRLATWQAAWTGWKDRLWLGWGLENFNVTFNKHFPEVVYEDEGSQVWFDRAHNLIFDRGVTTGAVGLLLYLFFLFYPAFLFFRQYQKEPEKRNTALVFFGLIIAFFVQDLFVFETITTYVILIFTWAFFGALLLPEYLTWRLPKFRPAWIALAVVYGLLLLPVMRTVNILPASMNTAAATAAREDPQTEDFFKIVKEFKVPLETSTYGVREYRIQFVEFVDQQLANIGAVAESVKPVIAYTDDLVDKQLKEYPDDAKNFLLAMRHYNYTFASDPDTKVARLQKALSYLPALIALSPGRPHVYQEAGYSHSYLARFYKEKGDTGAAQGELEQAEKFFRQAVDLNPKVVELHMNLLSLYMENGHNDKISEELKLMDASGADFRRQDYLNKLMSLARTNKNYQWTIFFTEEWLKLSPKDISNWINLAVSYAMSGNRQKAIETAEHIKSFGGDSVLQAEKFIEGVNSGFYDKQK